MSENNAIPITIDTGDNINVDLESSINVVTSGSYNDLSDQPSINNITLIGNKSLEDLGIIIPDVQSAIAQHNTSAIAHNDIRQLVSDEAAARITNDESLQNQINAKPSSEDIATAVSNHNISNVAHTDIRNMITAEVTNRENADNSLQSQIDGLTSKSDIVDIVGTYQELLAYDTSTLGDNDIIKVLSDSTHDNAMSYYRWQINTQSWVYVGSEGTYYTKAESDARFVPETRTINNKALSSNITLTAADVGAITSSALIGYATETWVQQYIASLDATNVRY